MANGTGSNLNFEEQLWTAAYILRNTMDPSLVNTAIPLIWQKQPPTWCWSRLKFSAMSGCERRKQYFIKK